MTCEHIRTLLAETALVNEANAANNPATMAEVASHLATCADCAAWARENERLFAMLPMVLAQVSEVQLPPHLKAKVMQSLEATSAAQPKRPTRGWAWPQFNANLWRKLGAAMLMLMLIATFGWALQLNSALSQERALRAEYANLLTFQQEMVLEVVDSPKANKLFLRSAQTDSTAYGKVFVRADLPHVVIMAARLPIPPAGLVYQMWLMRDGKYDMVGAMPVNPQGFGLIVFDADMNGPIYQKALLVAQPAGTNNPNAGTFIVAGER